MTRVIYLKAITSTHSASSEIQIQSEIHSLLTAIGISDIAMSPLVRYWKSQECGELTCRFSTSLPLSSIRQQFANRWEAATADSRWSTIHLSKVSFLWISD